MKAIKYFLPDEVIATISNTIAFIVILVYCIFKKLYANKCVEYAR